MLTPEYLANVMDKTEQKMSDLTKYLLDQMAESFEAIWERDGKIEFMPKHMYDLRKLENAGLLYNDIEKELSKRLPAIQKEIKAAFYDAAGEIEKGNNDFLKDLIDDIHKNGDLTDVGIPKTAEKYGMTAKELRMLESAYSRTNGEVTNLTRTTARSSITEFQKVCDDAYMKVSSGKNINTAITEAIEELARQGITTVSYGGRKDKIEVAIARAVRTGVNQANADIMLTRCAELGVNHVLVSQHVGARVTKANDYTNHSWWQGKVYSLDWNNDVLKKYNVTQEEKEEKKGLLGFFNKVREFVTSKFEKKYPDFIETCGYGDILGICGINCRHSFSMFYPKINKNTYKPISEEENRDRYGKEQHARALERKIRELKYTLSALEASGNKSAETMKKIDWCTDKLRETQADYRLFCQKNHISMENWRLKIAE